MKLPVALAHEPLVEAIFEVRFVDAPQLADLVPGILFTELDPKPIVHRQPAADIPKAVRASDPKLSHVAITRLELPRFNLMVGDSNIIVSCKLPYPKWASFKAEIMKFMSLISKQGFRAEVERYSLKFVNLVPASELDEQIAKINLDLKIGELKVVNNHLNLQVHHNEGGAVHILTLITGANGKRHDGAAMKGVVVDVDSIVNIEKTPFDVFVENLAPQVEDLRQVNKLKFFECLKSETIEEMGPEYE